MSSHQDPEVARLQKYIADHGKSVTRKLDELETDMIALESEAERLRSVRDGLTVERDAIIGLVARLAAAQGLAAGVTAANQVVIDLPAGQVSWEFAEPEAHLFAGLPAYEGAVEELTIEQKYGRVMNPGIASH